MPTPGHFILHTSAIPPLPAGDYVLEGDQQVAGGPTEPYAGHLRVTSPRYRLPPDQILSTFPPANAEGAFESRLPQIVMRRRTLPWERVADAGNRSVPWLALVVIAEGEGQLSAEVPVAQCVTPGTTLTGPNDVATGVYLGVTQTVVKAVFPTKDDLALLAHVREVDITDTELAMGDDDGYLAVVLANRLPQYDRQTCSPVRYLACLINLEGQLDVLPPPSPAIEIYDAGLVVQDIRLTDSAQYTNADTFTMGTGMVSAGTQATVGGMASNVTSHASTKASGWVYSAQQVEDAAVSAAPSDAARVARDVMASGWRVGVEFAVSEPTYRFPVLAYWSFTCTGAGSFETLMQGLDVGLLGTLPADPAARPRPECLPEPGGSAPPPAPPARPDPEGTETGHIGLAYLSRRGEDLRAWYRGPCTPHLTERDRPDARGHLPLAHTSDQLRRVVPDGREDLALAAAFEIGRLLALSQPSVVAALLRWRQEAFGAARAAALAQLALAGGPVQPDMDVVGDIGRLVGRDLVLRAAQNPTGVLAPGRALADPGRPIVHLSGGLDEILGAGFGFDAAAVRKRADTVGPLAALGEVPVPVQPTSEVDQKAVAKLKTALNDTVTSVAADALKAPAAAGRTGRPKRAAADALDALLAKAPGRKEGDA